MLGGLLVQQNIDTRLSNVMLRVKEFVVIDGLPLSLTFSTEGSNI